MDRDGNMKLGIKLYNIGVVNVGVMRMKQTNEVRSGYVTTEEYMKLYREDQAAQVVSNTESILCNSDMKLSDINELARRRDLREKKKRREAMEKAYKKYYIFGV